MRIVTIFCAIVLSGSFLNCLQTQSFAEDMGPKTIKAIDDVDDKITACRDKAENLAKWAGDFHNFTKMYLRDHAEIKHFDHDSLQVLDWERRAASWRDVKDKLKAAYSDYHKTCAKITGKLKKIDKLKKKDKTTGDWVWQ